MKALILFCLIVLIQSCAPAHSGSYGTISIMYAPDGTKCFVIVQDEQSRGISCQH